VSWSYDAEAAEVSDDAPTFAQPSIPIYKAAGFVPISYEAFADAANMTAEVGRLLAFGKDQLESSAFAIGSGVGQPTGIVTGLIAAPSSIVATATLDTLALADVYSVHDALPARYRANSSWLASNLIYSRIRQFGQDLWGSLADDRLPRLLNRPVLEAEDMDGTLTASQNNYVAIIGDFGQGYVIADSNRDHRRADSAFVWREPAANWSAWLVCPRPARRRSGGCWRVPNAQRLIPVLAALGLPGRVTLNPVSKSAVRIMPMDSSALGWRCSSLRDSASSSRSSVSIMPIPRCGAEIRRPRAAPRR
jgi:hypothetical protein